MCELLALSTSQPSRLTFSLHALASHGGETSTSRDGWGVAFYQGTDVALFRELVAAGTSPLVRYLETQGPSTTLAISHIRHATRGTVQFANTQPFARELGGHTHVFAHNGDLPDIERSSTLMLGTYRPVGQTVSEFAFCVLMARMQRLWDAGEPPAIQARLALVAAFAEELRELGPANFLYADGDVLFAHGHRRMQQSTRKAEPPGLWILQRHCADTVPPADSAAAGVAVEALERVALFIASVPLTDEAWRPLREGELLAVRHGEIVATLLPAPWHLERVPDGV